MPELDRILQNYVANSEEENGGVKSRHLSSARLSPLCQASIDITIAKEPPELIKRFVSSSGRDRASDFSLRLLLRLMYVMTHQVSVSVRRGVNGAR
jgi:hypothetical protein